MQELLKELISRSNPVEVFRGHYYCNNCVHNEIYYELHIVTNQDYMLSLLVDDTWTCDALGRNRVYPKHKVDYYFVHPDIKIEQKHIEIDDIDFLYYLPFDNVEKVFLGKEDYDSLNLPSDVEKLLKGETCRNLSCAEKSSFDISIVTTVFNNIKLIEQSIQSIINQNNPHVEYIVKDAGSKEDIQTLIDKYRRFIDIYVSNPDKGIYYGMDEGFKLSHGRYLQVLNSDDMYCADTLATYVEKIHESEVDYYAARMYFHKGEYVSIIKPNHILHHSIQTNHTTIALRKDLYFELGGFDFSYRSGADRNLLIKMLKVKSKSVIIDKCVAHFRATGFSSVANYSKVKEGLRNQLIGYPFDLQGYYGLFLEFVKVTVKKLLPCCIIDKLK